MLTVLTFLWNDPDRQRSYLFNADHVRTLRNMVSRNLSIPHQFVCVTDMAVPGVLTAPILWDKHVPGTVFVRLMMRKKSFAEYLVEHSHCEIPSRFLSLDLDMVVVDELKPLITFEDRFWRNPNWPAPRRAYYQTSVQLFTPGMYSELYDDFDPQTTPHWCRDRFGGAEQAWASERLAWDLPQWTDRDGIYGAGRIGDWNNGIQTSLPDNARLVSFPGNREPSQPDVQRKHPWVKEHYR